MFRPAVEFHARANTSLDPRIGRERFSAAEPIRIPVHGGSVRVFRVPAEESLKRPVVFVSGWGTIPESFYGFYSGLDADVEVFHVETREKSSSRIARANADFTMDRFAADIAESIDYLGLAHRNPVLVGTCFGSAVILHGLAHSILSAETAVCFDPMIRLWVPRWVTRVFGPVIPPFLLWILRPVIRWGVLAGMKEPVQRARAAAFINAAETWKWRRAAIQTQTWSVFDIAGDVGQPVYVVNGSHDRFHDSRLFPEVAGSLPRGVFLHVPVGEARREQLMGLIAAQFAAHHGPGTPTEIEPLVSK